MKSIGQKMLAILVVGIILIQGNINLVVAESQSSLKSQQSQNNEKINETKEELENIQAEKSEAQKQV